MGGGLQMKSGAILRIIFSITFKQRLDYKSAE